MGGFMAEYHFIEVTGSLDVNYLSDSEDKDKAEEELKTQMQYDFDCNDYNNNFDTQEITYNYFISENMQDLWEYYFESVYHKEYKDSSWFLEDGALVTYHQFEDKYAKNQFDTYSIYSDKDYQEKLKKKYRQEAFEECKKGI